MKKVITFALAMLIILLLSGCDAANRAEELADDRIKQRNKEVQSCIDLDGVPIRGDYDKSSIEPSNSPILFSKTLILTSESDIAFSNPSVVVMYFGFE